MCVYVCVFRSEDNLWESVLLQPRRSQGSNSGCLACVAGALLLALLCLSPPILGMELRVLRTIGKRSATKSCLLSLLFHFLKNGFIAFICVCMFRCMSMELGSMYPYLLGQLWGPGSLVHCCWPETFTCPHLPPRCRGTALSGLNWLQEIQTQLLTIGRQASYLLNHTPQLCILLSKKFPCRFPQRLCINCSILNPQVLAANK